MRQASQYCISLDLPFRTVINAISTTVASVMYQLASAIALLHQKGFTHGDLHPGNVMISAVDAEVKGNLCVVR